MLGSRHVDSRQNHGDARARIMDTPDPPLRRTHGDNIMLDIGAQAPDFELLDENGNAVRLADFRGKSSVVLMFYPADNTPGCTKQLCTARDDYDQYQAAGVAVFGVNPGSESAHKRFSEKHGLRTPLLLDDKGKVSRAYDALMPIPLLTMVNRTVVGIDRDGVVRFYERGMPPTRRILDAMSGAVPA
jgi:peroxiredoxin Q/BCP